MTGNSEERQIRLILLGDPGLFRAGLGRFLSGEPGFCVSECDKPAEALEVIERSVVDVVLLDFDTGSKPGNGFIPFARQSGYRGGFLIVTEILDARKSARVLKQGASGIFLKSEPPAQLIRAIKLVASGEAWVDQRVIQLIVDHLIQQHPRTDSPAIDWPLDEYERNVVVGILGGLSNRRISDNAGVSESFVKNIVQRLFRKAGVKSRSQFVRVALGGAPGASHEFLMPNPSDSENHTKSSVPRRRDGGRLVT
jgi:two-component system, NarL family, nitrate/nitrite response regulator NarL